MPTYLTYTVEQGVGTIEMARPEVYNALNEALKYELQDALRSASGDDAVRVVVITGQGKAFCSGQDLKSGDPAEDISFLETLRHQYNPIIRLIRDMNKPVICRLNGVAAGAGCSIALACDMIIASENAMLTEVFVNIGLVLDSGSSYFLPRLVGTARAFELATMGTRVKAAEALEMGLVNKVVPHDQLDKAVSEITDYYATAPTKAIGMIKQMLNRSGTSTLDEMLDYEAYCQEIAGNSQDYKEGVAAFLEKRKPKFKGK